MTGMLVNDAARYHPTESNVRLFATVGRPDWATHVATFGPFPRRDPDLVDTLRNSGLVGRGGAAFPVWRKIEALTGEPVAIIANAAEGEPLSHKDAALLASAPHLVLDGLLVLADALSPRTRLVLAVNPRSFDAARRAVADRPGGRRIEVLAAADGFVAGEVSAVVDSLAGGPGRPRDHPRHLTEKGLKGRPTLVFNAETLAHISLVARYGAAWFRSAGTAEDPGTRLVSVSGAGLDPHVREIDGATSLGNLLAACGVEQTAVQAVLVGGYHGVWVEPAELDMPLTSRETATTIGAGAGECGLHASGNILRYLASQSAQQCGPCTFGLPTLSAAFDTLARGYERETDTVRRMLTILPGRGACHHPDGTVRFATSSLETFADEITAHQAGTCRATAGRPR
jgi:NADH:ubiquinone oxidoreductase subunit F (NADH-binding)